MRRRRCPHVRGDDDRQGTGTAIADGVHRLTNGVSNFYLIKENGKLVLVDAGAPKDWARLTSADPGSAASRAILAEAARDALREGGL